MFKTPQSPRIGGTHAPLAPGRAACDRGPVVLKTLVAAAAAKLCWSTAGPPLGAEFVCRTPEGPAVRQVR